MLSKFPRISFWGKYNRMLNGIYSQVCCFYSFFSPALISSPSQWLLLWELRGRGFILRCFQYHSNERKGVRCLQPAGTSHLHRCSCPACPAVPRTSQHPASCGRQLRVARHGAGWLFAEGPQKTQKIIKQIVKKKKKKAKMTPSQIHFLQMYFLFI